MNNHRFVRAAAVFGLAAGLLGGAEPQAALKFTGSPLAIPFTCKPEDVQWAGLSCADEPCPIFVELSHAAGRGGVIVVTGNLHAESATLYSLLLRSEDGGKTWREPWERMRGVELDGVQFMDARTAWISGVVVQPLPVDPFFLLTRDAGAGWEKISLFEEGMPGMVQQFWFDSGDHGLALIDRRSGPMRYEVWESNSAGRSWMMREKSGTPAKVSDGEAEWRVRAERKIFRLERLEDGHWSPVVAFAGSAGMCRDQQPE